MKFSKLFFIYILFFFSSSYSGLLEDANTLYNQGKLTEAIQTYRKALREGENPAMCYFNLANAFFQIDSLPQSIVYYRSAIMYAPSFFRNHLNLAIAYYSLDEIGECIASISRALQIEPDNEKALMILAASYRRAGAIPEAVAAFEHLVSLYPATEDAYIALAEMYHELSDNVQAIEWLLRYPESGKNKAYVSKLLSEIYEETNNIDRALYYARVTFEKESSNRWAFYRICTLMEMTGNDLVALEEARRGLELFPDFGDLALFAGNIAIKYEKIDDARRFYTIAERNGHPNAVIGLENIRKIIQSKDELLKSVE